MEILYLIALDLPDFEYSCRGFDQLKSASPEEDGTPIRAVVVFDVDAG